MAYTVDHEAAADRKPRHQVLLGKVLAGSKLTLFCYNVMGEGGGGVEVGTKWKKYMKTCWFS